MEEHTEIETGHVEERYEIDIDEVRVNLVTPQKGRDYTVTHTLKVPTEGQLHEYDKKTGNVRMVKKNVIEFGGGNLKAACDLWRQLIVRIEGYKGGPYSPQDPNWQAIEKKIPANHKRAAVNQVVSTAGLEEEEKNE